MLIASHNLMEGRFLAALCRHHQRLQAARGLHVLCLQESRDDGVACAASRIAAALGRRYGYARSESAYGLGVVYDRDHLELLDLELVPLPPVPAMSWLERRFILDGRPLRMQGMLARFARAGGEPLTLVNLHLDTVGGTAQRRRQMRAVADHLRGRGLTRGVVACGDVNAFAPGHARHRRALRSVLEPLTTLGIDDPSTEATHFFARQNEPKLAHRMMVALGRLGLDMPQRFDVVCTDLPVRARGTVATPESDHDLVWAELAPAG